MKISAVDAFSIFDSRGNPTLEVEVRVEGGLVGRGLVPSGASTGQFEACELRDGDPHRLRGRSVEQAIANVRGELSDAVLGADVLDQAEVDRRMIELDGTDNKTRLGANAILGVSLAVADAAARVRQAPLFESLTDGQGVLLPLPQIQIVGGGAHANWRTDIQDFLIIAVGARSFSETLEMTFNVYHLAGDLLKQRAAYCGLADEGGYWPTFDTNEAVLEFLVQAIEAAGYVPGEEIAIALDVAASDFYDATAETYDLRLDGRQLSSGEMLELMGRWRRQYPILSIEDPVADVDWAGWQTFCEHEGQNLQIVGDDLFTTNRTRIAAGIQRGAANSVLIKLNQIGTVTETIEAIRQVQEAGWLPIVSARSGETEDAFISHLAVATNAGQLKVGSFARSERMAKWNECLRIERALGERARYEGGAIFQRILGQ